MNNKKLNDFDFILNPIVEEITQHVSTIESNFQLAITEPENQVKYLCDILEAIQNIHDLVMVHGYEGIEKLADNLHSIAKTLKNKNELLTTEIYAEITYILNAIKYFCNNSDKINEHEIITEVLLKLNPELKQDPEEAKSQTFIGKTYIKEKAYTKSINFNEQEPHIDQQEQSTIHPHQTNGTEDNEEHSTLHQTQDTTITTTTLLEPDEAFPGEEEIITEKPVEELVSPVEHDFSNFQFIEEDKGFKSFFFSKLKRLKQFSKKNDSVIGLDIGTSSLKIVVLQKTDGKFILKHWRIYEFEDYSSESHNIKNIQQVLSDFFKKNKKFRNLPIITSLVDNSITARYVTLPNLPDEEVVKSVELDIQSELNDTDSEVEIFTFPSDLKDNDDLDYKSGIVLAVEKKILSQTYSLIKDTKLNISNINIDAISLYYIIAESSNEPTAIIDVGANKVKIVIVHNNEIRFIQNIDSFQKKLNSEIASFIGGDIDQAETFKRQIKFLIDESLPNVFNIQKLKGEQGTLQNVAFPIINKFVHEIESVLHAYNSDNSDQRVEKIYLVGGGVQLKGLENFMSIVLDMPVSIINPLENIEITKRRASSVIIHKIAPRLATAIGLAKSYFFDSGKFKIDLRSEEKSDNKSIGKLSKITIFTITIFMIIAYILQQNYKIQVIRYKTKIKKNQQFITELKEHVEDLKDYTRLNYETDTQLKKIHYLKNVQPEWSTILKNISMKTPKGITIQNFQGQLDTPINFTGNSQQQNQFVKITITGITKNSKLIQELVNSLETSKDFRDADFKTVNLVENKKTNISNFQIEGKVEIVKDNN